MNLAYQGKHPPTQHAAMAARTNCATKETQEQPWYANRGAKNHVTTALKNLSLQEPDKGDEKVAVGNGTCLFIANRGSNVLHNSIKLFKLNSILQCLSTAANLLSIYIFCTPTIL